MSPEMLLKKGNYDYKTDIWSIGVVVAEKVLGSNELFSGKNSKEVFDSIQKWNLQNPKFFTKNVYLNDILILMLQFDPSKRPDASFLLQKLFTNWNEMITLH